MILKIFSQKKIAKKLAFLTQNKAKLCKFLIMTLDFEKNANSFAENWQKSQKIVIITSTPSLVTNNCFSRMRMPKTSVDCDGDPCLKVANQERNYVNQIYFYYL
jgi:hypothetical protein